MKITMLQEQMVVNDPVVLESLEEFKHLLDDILEEMAEEGEDINMIRNVKKETALSMDDILDKISKYGIKSLTPLEKEFLDSHKSGKQEELHDKLAKSESETTFEDDNGLFKFEFDSFWCDFITEPIWRYCI